MNNEIYEPREDSYLLQKYVKKFSKGNVLDIGTGSGIQALTAAENAEKVTAAEINKKAIKQAKLQAEIEKIKNIEFVESDLFDNIKGKFDLICFNPPYLPKEKHVKDKALVSGKRGYDTTIRFLNSVGNYLKQEGIILLINSSLTSLAVIEENIKKNLFNFKILEKKHVFFEDILVYKIEKSPLLKKLEKLKIKNPKLFSRGKRGMIIKGEYNKKHVGVKVKKDSSTALGTIKNEAKFLKILNKKNIGPKLIKNDKDYLMYEFQEGIFIEEFLETKSKKDIIILLKKVFEQMYQLDSMGINKFEMHRPLKHIIIKNNKPVLLDTKKSEISRISKTTLSVVLLDFERCRYTEDPKNVSQFCDFLIGKKINKKLSDKNIKINKKKIIYAAKEYKNKPNKKNFKKIITLLK